MPPNHPPTPPPRRVKEIDSATPRRSANDVVYVSSSSDHELSVPPTSVTPATPVEYDGDDHDQYELADDELESHEHDSALAAHEHLAAQQSSPPSTPPRSMLPRHREPRDEDALDVDADNVHGSSPRSVSSSAARQRREQRQASASSATATDENGNPIPVPSERRESLVSNDSARSSNHRAQQRKMMMAQQMSLGIDGESVFVAWAGN